MTNCSAPWVTDPPCIASQTRKINRPTNTLNPRWVQSVLFYINSETVKKSELDIRLVKVAEVADHCHLNRWEILRYGNRAEDIAIDLNARVEADHASDMLTLRLEALYTYMRGMVKRPLLSHTVEAVFEIPSLAEYVTFNQTRDKVDLPPSVMSLMLSVAIGALRGMIAQKTAGTALENRPMPLINLTELVSRLIYGQRHDGVVIPVDDPIYR